MTTGRAKPRILWVTEEPPDFNLGGGNVRQAHLFRALAAAFPVELLATAPVRDREIREAAVKLTELHPSPARWTDHPVGRRALELAISLCSPDPLPLYMAGPSRRAITQAARRPDSRYELVCVEHEALAPLGEALPADRRMLTFHNLLSGVIGADLAMAPGRRQRWFRARDARKALALERRALTAYDRCVVCSEEDAHTLRGIGATWPGSRVEVVPNGVDLEKFAPSPAPGGAEVLFPGTLSYPPNAEGARWFCAEVWPRILRAAPGAMLTLAGRDPPPSVRALGELPGVRVHANVPSMVDYFERARAVVVPLRKGTGTRLKALEAMACARPVIGTSVGLEGIGAQHGVNALVADGAEDFAQAVLRALAEDALARELGIAGRRHVEARFGWDGIATRFVSLVASVLRT